MDKYSTLFNKFNSYLGISSKDKYPNVTGVTQPFDVDGTIKLALKLYPEARAVEILSDSSEESRGLSQRFKAENGRYPRVAIKYIEDADLLGPKFYSSLSRIGNDSIVLLCPWRGMPANEYDSLDSFAREVRRNIKYPYFCLDDALLGIGGAGGVFCTSIEQGRQAAELIKAVIRNGGAQSIPIVQGRCMPVFDYDVLAKARLDMSVLPDDTQYINKPARIVDSIVGSKAFLFLCGFVTISAWCLGYWMAKMRTSAWYGRLLASLPVRMAVVSRGEKVLFYSNECHAAAPESGNSRPATLKDMPDADYLRLSTALGNVFLNRDAACLEYERKSVK